LRYWGRGLSSAGRQMTSAMTCATLLRRVPT
jgi:hypothetical protein